MPNTKPSKLERHLRDLETFETRVARVRAEFAAGDLETRKRLLRPAHARNRFENYDPHASSISDADARLLIANEEGYAFWSKYESYLHLDPAVRDVITAVRDGELERLQHVLREDPSAANPHWVPGFEIPKPIHNDSIPLFCVSEAVFRGTNKRGNEYEITRTLLAAGADVDIEGGHPLTAAVSYNAIRVVEALIEGGAAVDGVDGDGVPMAYAMHFTFRDIAELLARRGARLDVRFAAGLGKMDVVKSFFNAGGSLKPGAGALADPFGLERKHRGESAFWCERTRGNILSQALYFACIHNELEVAEFLLAQGADINAIVPGLDIKATVLHRVAALGIIGDDRSSAAPIESRAAIIQFLLERGASLSARDGEYHTTPVAWAHYCGRHDVFELLIDRAGIHDLVVFGRVDRLREVLAADPSLCTARDDRGKTPLHYLDRNLKNAKEIIDLLVGHGADVNARDFAGRRPCVFE
jgi:ankyrin repeat protein